MIFSPPYLENMRIEIEERTEVDKRSLCPRSQ
jgi:hypothetical protein